MPRTQYDVIQCNGGWDQITPTLSLKNGTLRNALNYECNVTGGYTKISGYCRFDGQTSPMSASYSVLWASPLTNAPSVSQTITGATSGATGIVAAVYIDHIIVTNTTGTFAINEVIKVGTTVIGTTIASLYAISASEDAINTVASQAIYAAAITALPGVGATSGGFMLDGVVYGFRAITLGGAVLMYKSTTSGWVQVNYLYELYFTGESVGATGYPVDGATITQGGVTATVNRVCLQSGAWLGATATGKFIITAPAGGNFAAGAASITGVTGTVTVAAVQTAIAMSTGGTIEYVNANFTGSSLTERIYACDGINRAFEFDGTTLVPIDNGSNLIPKHIIAYRNYLLLMVQSSIIWSAIGAPYDYSADHGSGEEALGDTGTGMAIMPGNATTSALNIMTQNNTYVLYGTDATTWQLTPYNTGVGAMDYSMFNMQQTYGFDSRGIFGLQTTLQYGNFTQTMLTRNIQPFIQSNYGNFSYACLNRRKSQYRAFFNNGYGLYLTIVNGQYMGAMPVQFPDPVRMAFEDKFPNGSDADFFFGKSGMVYQMEQGNNFDGAPMLHYMTPIYDSVQSPRIYKRFLKSSIEVYSSGWMQLGFSYSLGYGNTGYAQPGTVNYANSFLEPYFDAGLTFDSNVSFDTQSVSPIDCMMGGTAENCAVTIGGNSAYISQYTVNSIIIHYQMRRGKR